MQELLIHDEAGVRTLKLNRPDRLNAFNDELSSALIDALWAASKDDAVRVVVITGEGRGFCSGLDLTKFMEPSASLASRFNNLDDLEWVGRLVLAIVQNNKPVIAAINGVAAGAGMSMALACDFRFMTESAKLTSGYIRRALSPDAGMTYFLPRLIGQTKATELILTGRDVSSKEAHQLGMINEVIADNLFAQTVSTFAAQLAEGPPVALTLSKRMLVASPDTDLIPQLKQELTALRQCFTTNDVREGVVSMMEKRKPVFTGK